VRRVSAARCVPFVCGCRLFGLSSGCLLRAWLAQMCHDRGYLVLPDDIELDFDGCANSLALARSAHTCPMMSPPAGHRARHPGLWALC